MCSCVHSPRRGGIEAATPLSGRTGAPERGRAPLWCGRAQGECRARACAEKNECARNEKRRPSKSKTKAFVLLREGLRAERHDGSKENGRGCSEEQRRPSVFARMRGVGAEGACAVRRRGGRSARAVGVVRRAQVRRGRQVGAGSGRISGRGPFPSVVPAPLRRGWGGAVPPAGLCGACATAEIP